MKTAFLHVGLPKTGSTSIQEFLFHEREAMEADGFLFPYAISEAREARIAAGEGWGRHASLLAAIQGDWDALAPGEWDHWRAEFRRFRESEKLHTVIVSHETIGNRAAHLDLSVLQELLDGHRVRVLLVVREAEGWLASLHEQRVTGRRRMSGTASKFNIVNEFIRGGLRSRVEALKAAFSGAELLVVPFETLVSGDGLVPNTAKLIGLSPELIARAGEAKRVNISFSQDRVEILRRCNAAEMPMETFSAVRRGLAAGQRRSKAPRKARGRVFPPDIAEAIAERYDADRAWLREEFGVELPARKDTPPPPFEPGDDELEAVLEESRRIIEPAVFEQAAAAIRFVPEAPTTQRGMRGRQRRERPTAAQSRDA